MNIREIHENKKQFLPLLLLADEQEDMIDRYLDRGELWVLEESRPRTVAVVTDEGGGSCELKALATCPDCQGQGYGRAMVDWLCRHYAAGYEVMLVGTGETPSHLRFYQGCGFSLSHRVPGFFTRNYRHPIVEEGVTLRDMVYLRRSLAGLSDRGCL